VDDGLDVVEAHIRSSDHSSGVRPFLVDALAFLLEDVEADGVGLEGPGVLRLLGQQPLQTGVLGSDDSRGLLLVSIDVGPQQRLDTLDQRRWRTLPTYISSTRCLGLSDSLCNRA
jgi:hypothetical protein